MVDKNYHGQLQIEDDIKREQHEWLAERIFWSFGLLFIIAAALGLLGSNGPLATATAANAQGLSVEYQRFARYTAPGELELTFSQGERETDEIGIWINRNYIDAIQLEQITPEPQRMEIENGRLYFYFNQTATDKSVKIAFDYKIKHFGVQKIQLGIVDGPTVEFTQIIYP